MPEARVTDGRAALLLHAILLLELPVREMANEGTGMRDYMVQAAGALAVFTAIAHGVLGETKVFAKVDIQPARVKLLIRLVWQCSAVAWAAFGILLVCVPYISTANARHWIIAMAIATFGFAAVANAWATKGRHFGWFILALTCVLAMAGR